MAGYRGVVKEGNNALFRHLPHDTRSTFTRRGFLGDRELRES